MAKLGQLPEGLRRLRLTLTWLAVIGGGGIFWLVIILNHAWERDLTWWLISVPICFGPALAVWFGMSTVYWVIDGFQRGNG